jgi:hypothetical protein
MDPKDKDGVVFFITAGRPGTGNSYRVLRTAVFFQNVKKPAAMIFTSLILP